MLYGAGDLRLEQRELHPSSLAPGEVYVETEVSGFSTGTDLGNYEGRSTEVPGAPPYPRWVGYSNVGVVKAAAPGATAAVGTRVFAGKPHQSAYIAKPGEMMVPVPEGVSPEQASLAYLTHLGVAAMRHVRYEPGESVAVVGLGVIGLGTCAIARSMGARVYAVANSEKRAEAALRVGAHRAVVAGRDPLPSDIDVVVLTANTWGAWRDSMEMARLLGRVAVLGFPGRAQQPPDFNPLDAKWLYGKQLTITGSGLASRLECPASDIRFNVRRGLEFVLAQMATGAIDLEPIITHRFPALKMKEAYDLAVSHSKDLMGAVFDWRGVDGSARSRA